MLTSARPSVGGVVALVLLVTCAPPPATAVRELAALPDAVGPATPLVSAVALLAWGLAVWLGTAGVLTLLSRAPGPLGRASSALVRRWAPAAVRRSLELALGLTAATGAVSAGTAHALPLSVPTETAHSVLDRPSGAEPRTRTDARPSEPAALDLDWPTTAPAAAPTTAPPNPPATAPPTAPPNPPATAPPNPPATASTTAATAPSRGPSTVRPTDLPPVRGDADAPAGAEPPVAPAAQPPAPPSGGRSGAPTAVVVRPGDTLWGLAEASLQRAGVAQPSDSCIAQTWPLWWAANRDVIGDDPHLILPGTVLSPPADRAPGATAGP